MKRIPYPLKKDHDCILVSVKCTCECHEEGIKMMHMQPCCYDGYTYKYTNIKPIKK